MITFTFISCLRYVFFFFLIWLLLGFVSLRYGRRCNWNAHQMCSASVTPCPSIKNAHHLFLLWKIDKREWNQPKTIDYSAFQPSKWIAVEIYSILNSTIWLNPTHIYYFCNQQFELILYKFITELRKLFTLCRFRISSVRKSIIWSSLVSIRRKKKYSKSEF